MGKITVGVDFYPLGRCRWLYVPARRACARCSRRLACATHKKSSWWKGRGKQERRSLKMNGDGGGGICSTRLSYVLPCIRCENKKTKRKNGKLKIPPWLTCTGISLTNTPKNGCRGWGGQRKRGGRAKKGGGCYSHPGCKAHPSGASGDFEPRPRSGRAIQQSPFWKCWWDERVCCPF